MSSVAFREVSKRYGTVEAVLDGWATRATHLSDELAGLKESGQAVGAEALTQLAGFAPPTVHGADTLRSPRLRVTPQTGTVKQKTVPSPSVDSTDNSPP